jgi:hypothetical protein
MRCGISAASGEELCTFPPSFAVEGIKGELWLSGEGLPPIDDKACSEPGLDIPFERALWEGPRPTPNLSSAEAREEVPVLKGEVKGRCEGAWEVEAKGCGGGICIRSSPIPCMPKGLAGKSEESSGGGGWTAEEGSSMAKGGTVAGTVTSGRDTCKEAGIIAEVSDLIGKDGGTACVM